MTGEPAGASIYLGDATLVPGARPDIASTYPTTPYASRAGWGYLLLTNLLPNKGNGTFTLSIYADDREGQTTLLGTRTVTVTNASASKPFGTIDTPQPGETISGKAYVNFGWALTPLPKSIVTDGSTINVYIDGAKVGPVGYNAYRADLATLFPGLANTMGAAGARVIDTTKYANGLHTISWAVTDTAGVGEGIGSRYFTIQNGAALSASGSRLSASGLSITSVDGHSRLKPDATKDITIRRGYDETRPFESIARADDGAFIVHSHALERLEIDLGAGATLDTTLPIGSTLDTVRGVLTWQPGPGFLGTYDLVFTGAAGDHIVVRVVLGQEPDRSSR